jgi:ribosomal protein L32
MAVPKRKTSHSKKRMRSSNKALTSPAYQVKNGEPVRSHHVSLKSLEKKVEKVAKVA